KVVGIRPGLSSGETDVFQKCATDPASCGLRESERSRHWTLNRVDIAVLPVMSNAANQFQAVQPWHHPVTEDDRKGLVLKGRPSLCSIRRGEHIVSPPLKCL